MKRLLLAITFVAVIGLASTGLYLRHVHMGLRRAKDLTASSLWEYAIPELDRYLWLHPHDSGANLLIAEALIKDEQNPGGEPVHRALKHLQRIPDDVSEAAEARSQEAHLYFLLLRKPAQAEKSLRRALAVDPDHRQANYTYWKLLDMTGRSHLAAPYFWKVFDKTPLGERPVRLREWYLSQFFPATANPALVELMGLTDLSDIPLDDPEFQRFYLFRHSEPEEALSYGMLARWFHYQGAPDDALAVINDGLKRAKNPHREPLFLATLIAVLIDLGELDRAEKVFAQWPQPHEGYEYWATRADVLDNVAKDYAGAALAYDKVLQTDWPGPADWRTRSLFANCLFRTGVKEDAERAKQLRKEVDKITSILRDETHSELEAKMGNLTEPDSLESIAEFYEKIGCRREATAWRELLKSLNEFRDSS
ncbi:MAG: hypothetical protein QGG36_30705 [Pirellulaceae bacterium]|jgi:tetratricopeptide (TPR) repeat protein|nr:hypothetical protein [Pirellulaceae bacterium]MDP7020208.1 hypothetical protein [Pirellulaceae bacterium]